MKKILLAILVASISILYLFQHRYSISCTQELAKLEKQQQLMKEELTALECQKAKVFLFSNLEDTAKQLNLTFPKNARDSEGKFTPTNFTTMIAKKSNQNSLPITAKSNE